LQFGEFFVRSVDALPGTVRGPADEDDEQDDGRDENGQPEFDALIHENDVWMIAPRRKNANSASGDFRVI
jgi:hypothetical protein